MIDAHLSQTDIYPPAARQGPSKLATAKGRSNRTLTEYPYLYHRADFPDAGYDGEIGPGMTLCVESYIGETGGAEGVKLEQQVLVTRTGLELLSRYPFEPALLG